MNLQDYIYQCLIGQMVQYEGEVYHVKQAYFQGASYGGVSFSVKISNKSGDEVVPMTDVEVLGPYD